MSTDAEENIMARDELTWRNYIAERLRANELHVAQLAEQHRLFQAELVKNTTSTEAVEKNTAEMLTVFNSWKGAMLALEFLAKVAKWIGTIAAVLAAGYVFLKTGNMDHVGK